LRIDDWLGLALLLAAGGVVYWVWLVAFTALSLTGPPRRTYAKALARNQPGDPSELTPARAFEAFTVRSRGRKLPCWRIAGDDPAGPVAIGTPGWADSRIGGLFRLAALAPRCSAIMLWDPPGLGDAPGRCPLGMREHEDLLAVLETLSDVDRSRGLVLVGWSMGAGIAIAAAARLIERGDDAQLRGVLAEAPYDLPPTPARRVLELRRMPWRLNLLPTLWLVGVLNGVGPRWRGFDRRVLARRLAGRVPMLVLIGSEDEVCPAAGARAIAQAARADFAEIPGGRHNDLWTTPSLAEACRGRIDAFLATLRP
jgi:pimeloyl-ACP methyl ester carboxylesterase